MKKILSFVGGLVLVLGGGAVQAQTLTPGYTSSNLVPVYSCQQVGNDIRVRRTVNTPEYILPSTCRDAGHGLREYKLTCTANNKYRVEWRSCSTPTTPADTTGPSVSVSFLPVPSVSNSYQITVTASDTNNLRAVYVTIRDANNTIVENFWVDGITTNSGTNLGVKTLTRTYQKTNLVGGKYYMVTVTAYDTAGNVNTSNSGWVFVSGTASDTTNPVISGQVLYSSTVVNGNTIFMPRLVANASDTSGQLKQVVLYYSIVGWLGMGSPYQAIKVCSNTSSPTQCSYNFNSSAHGYFYAQATDYAGNVTQTDKFNF